MSGGPFGWYFEPGRGSFRELEQGMPALMLKCLLLAERSHPWQR